MKWSKVAVPAINPVFKESHRPFWSVMIPTYNCANQLSETLESVLKQDPGSEEMQIEVVDDCSTEDDPERIVKEISKGRVSVFRQPQNVGATANFNTCIQRAKGQWVHILHGDDAVLSGFYSRLRFALEQESTVGAAFCRYIYMNGESHWLSLSRLERKTPGILQNWLEQISVANLIETPAIVVRRSVYERLGGFHLELCHAADWEMWKRIAANHPVWYEPQPLACYRSHSSSDSSRLVKSGTNVADTRRAIEISQSYLPAMTAAELSEQAKENCAFNALNTASRMLSVGDIDAAMAQVREGVKSSQSSNVIESVLMLMQELVKNSKQYDLQPIDILELFLSACQELLQQHYTDSLTKHLKLKKTNLIIFPDWGQPETSLYQELTSVITSLVNHHDKNKITLLINIDYLSEDEASLFLSELVLNLFLEKDLDVADGPEISLFGRLNEKEWQILLPQIQARILLENENQCVTAAVEVKNILVHQIKNLSELSSISI